MTPWQPLAKIISCNIVAFNPVQWCRPPLSYHPITEAYFSTSFLAINGTSLKMTANQSEAMQYVHWSAMISMFSKRFYDSNWSWLHLDLAPKYVLRHWYVSNIQDLRFRNLITCPNVENRLQQSQLIKSCWHYCTTHTNVTPAKCDQLFWRQLI